MTFLRLNLKNSKNQEDLSLLFLNIQFQDYNPLKFQFFSPRVINPLKKSSITANSGQEGCQNRSKSIKVVT